MINQLIMMSKKFVLILKWLKHLNAVLHSPRNTLPTTHLTGLFPTVSTQWPPNGSLGDDPGLVSFCVKIPISECRKSHRETPVECVVYSVQFIEYSIQLYSVSVHPGLGGDLVQRLCRPMIHCTHYSQPVTITVHSALIYAMYHVVGSGHYTLHSTYLQCAVYCVHYMCIALLYTV